MLKSRQGSRCQSVQAITGAKGGHPLSSASGCDVGGRLLSVLIVHARFFHLKLLLHQPFF